MLTQKLFFAITQSVSLSFSLPLFLSLPLSHSLCHAACVYVCVCIHACAHSFSKTLPDLHVFNSGFKMNQFQIISSPTPISLAIISGVDLLRFEGLAIMVILGEEIQFILVSL